MENSRDSITSHSPAPSDRLQELGMYWRSALHSISPERCSIFFLHHFGYFRLHTSLYDETKYDETKATKPVKPDKLPPYTQLMGQIHNSLRYELPQRLGIHLDEAHLDDKTRAAIQSFDKLIRKWRIAVLRTRETKDGHFTQANYRNLPQETINEIKTESAKIVADLKSVFSEEHLPSIPVLLGGGGDEEHAATIHIENNGAVGLFLFGIPRVQRQLLDLNKLPPEFQEFLSSIIGEGSDIIKNMQSKFAPFPELLERYEAACAECCNSIISLINANAHALQMVNVMTAGPVENVYTSLLMKAGLPPYPKTLNTSEECALVLQALQARLHTAERIGYDKSVLLNFTTQCDKIARNARQYIDPDVLTSAATIILQEIKEDIEAGMAEPTKPIAKVKLVERFILKEQSKWAGRTAFTQGGGHGL